MKYFLFSRFAGAGSMMEYHEASLFMAMSEIKISAIHLCL